MEKFLADATVKTNSVGDLLNIGSNLFAKIGNLVDKTYFGGEKSVSAILN